MRIETLDDYIRDFGKIERIAFARKIWKLPNKKLVVVKIPYIAR